MSPRIGVASPVIWTRAAIRDGRCASSSADLIVASSSLIGRQLDMRSFSGCRPVGAEANGGRPIVSRAYRGNQGARPGIAPAILLAALLFASGPAAAGPPFTTDDPEPTDTGHWEDYLYSTAIRADHLSSGTALGLELNYGAAPD